MTVPALVPAPLSLAPCAGSLPLGPEAAIAATGADAAAVAELLAAYLRPATGFAWPTDGDPAKAPVLLEQTGTAEPGVTDEAYTIAIEATQARLSARTAAGLARAVQVLRQLLPAEIFAPAPQALDWALPCLRIADAPRFRWRGLHLDVCRHFFPLEAVKRYIDLLALHRMNVCHLHLTEDQGWRMEIRKYPLLTEVGQWRDCTLIGHEGARPRRYDGQRYGGCYTQEELRDLVAFAAARHVTLVPEIDMPGHMQAAIAAYPELGNTNMTIRPRCHWGISQHILNLEPATLAFMQDVLDEVMDVFPGPFIHVGGDEAVKHQWSESMHAQARMAELNLQGEDQLQSWFIKQMDNHISAAGRRLIGWDEILEGGLAPGAAVMSWRGEEGGIEAARQGHDVVMAPSQWVYFDHYQAEPKAEEPLAIGGMTPTDRVYAWEPIPAALPAEKHHHVLGGQGQLWTEYIPDSAKLDYMAYPRACALAEVLWLPAEKKSYTDFHTRLGAHRDRLDALGVNAHPRP